MAATKPCEQFIPGFGIEEVMGEGKQVRHLPTSDGFSLDVDSAEFALGVGANVGMHIKGKPFDIEGAVTQFDPTAGIIEIKGETKGVGKAEVWINLQDGIDEETEEEGTIILSGVKFGLFGLKKGAELLIARHLNHHLPPYSEAFTENVHKGLLLGNKKSRRRVPQLA